MSCQRLPWPEERGIRIRGLRWNNTPSFTRCFARTGQWTKERLVGKLVSVYVRPPGSRWWNPRTRFFRARATEWTQIRRGRDGCGLWERREKESWEVKVCYNGARSAECTYPMLHHCTWSHFEAAINCIIGWFEDSKCLYFLRLDHHTVLAIHVLINDCFENAMKGSSFRPCDEA